MIVWVFPVLAAFGVCVAFLLKYWLSGKNLNAVGLYFCVAFNISVAVPHMNIIENKYFLFWGSRPDVISDHPFIGWIAFVCIFLHCAALPYKEWD